MKALLAAVWRVGEGRLAFDKLLKHAEAGFRLADDGERMLIESSSWEWE